MNLHSLARGLIASVNPEAICLLQTSTGYTTAAGGRQTPSYNAPVYPSAQVQSLSTQDLRQLDALSIQGSSRKIYLNGAVNAIVRVSAKGGDLITLADGTVWLTTAVLEQWDDWCCVAVTLQDDVVDLQNLDFSNPANSMYAPLVA